MVLRQVEKQQDADIYGTCAAFKLAQIYLHSEE